MLRSALVPAVVAILLGWSATPVSAGGPLQTDANLVTALDLSDSIMGHEEWLEFEGLAKAVTSAAVLDAIARGRHGRIGFAVFTWSSSGHFQLLVPWTQIASSADAERVAAALRQAPAIDRSEWARRGNGSDEPPARPDRRTDISAAIDFAIDLVLLTPYRSTRSVINVCANGKDNVAPGPRAGRDRAVAAGMVINALVVGTKPGMASYFREQVQGGAGSFVLEVTRPEAVAAAMVEKLLRDLVAAPAAPGGPFT